MGRLSVSRVSKVVIQLSLHPSCLTINLTEPRLSANDRVDPFVALYDPPSPSWIGNVTHLCWRGLLSPSFVQRVLEAALWVTFFVFLPLFPDHVPETLQVHRTRMHRGTLPFSVLLHKGYPKVQSPTSLVILAKEKHWICTAQCGFQGRRERILGVCWSPL